MLIQAFHGLAYGLFHDRRSVFVGAMAPEAIGASAQSLIFIATSGIGLFLGTQLAGYVMSRNSEGETFQWRNLGRAAGDHAGRSDRLCRILPRSIAKTSKSRTATEGRASHAEGV